MGHSPSRRTFLLAAAALPFASAWAAARPDAASAHLQLQQLERAFNGRLGLFALNTGHGAQLGYRATERFPVCSTFKVLLAAAILQRSTQTPGLMQQRIQYIKRDLVSYSPISEKHLETGMTVAELCAAAVQYSDNTASNLLMKLLGGPAGVTAYARSIGDAEFRLDRWETDLNTAIPGDPRDTSTPEAMGRSVQRLALGDALQAPQREQLQTWLRGNTTGATRIRAGVPSAWQVGDKTGTGDYGTTNDIAVLWPPQRAPVVVAVYVTQQAQDAKARNDVVASAARIVVGWLG
ncbi:class A beta-lactamase [Pseudomonas cavernicola]|uniref:Beta-lactamase n=1 Tax=Pseudomonas cavernicola TaxID=2320866 RepID=A0A418XI78_9PSED|nr:class A beta-lactamase [Pseudomonas cavernicola]RJG12160.1 class A beta-lactamase [Pseudomonas cavernicola]